MVEAELRNTVVSVMKGWLGYSEANGKHKKIIDLYNTQRPLPRGYKVQYTDEWCATTVSAAGIASGLSDIIFPECSCSAMIKLYQTAGRWMENDGYVPAPGDIIMYYWKDGANYATTDCTAAPNHVGMVEKVVGTTITVIEGNKGEAVARRTVPINGRYIRGYCIPNYKSKEESEMTQEQFNRMMDVWLAENAEKKPSVWADSVWNRAQAAEVVDGSAPQNPATREQVVVILDRLGLIK